MIVNRMTEEEELAQEIYDTEEHQTILTEMITFVCNFLQAMASPLSPRSPPTATNTIDYRGAHNTLGLETPILNVLVHTSDP